MPFVYTFHGSIEVHLVKATHFFYFVLRVNIVLLAFVVCLVSSGKMNER